MAKYIIGVNPNRQVTKAANCGVAKYATVAADKRFKWGTDIDAATVFPTAQAAFEAMGKRARALKTGKITADVLVHEVQGRGLSIVRTINGT